MTDERYIRKIADLLGLAHWEINVRSGPEEAEHLASCRCIDGAHEATIWLSEDYQSLGAEDKRETAVHEVIHIHQDPCFQMIATDLPPMLGLLAITPFLASYRRNMEFEVDGLAKAIAPLLPLP